MRVAALALLLAAAAPPVHHHARRHRHAIPARPTSHEWNSIETYGTADARPNGPPDQSPGWGSYEAQARAVDAVGGYGAGGTPVAEPSGQDKPASRSGRPR